MNKQNGGPQNPRVLISGASIAGPALAFWLHRYGFDVTLVEKAPKLRRGGQAVDFKGATHRMRTVRLLQTEGLGLPTARRETR